MDRTQVLEAIQKLRGQAYDAQGGMDSMAMATGNAEADKEIQDAYMAMFQVLKHLRTAHEIIKNQ